MEEDPIEGVDPLDNLIMHAETRIHEMKMCKQRMVKEVMALNASLSQWQAHLSTLYHAQSTQLRLTEATEPSNLSVPSPASISFSTR